VRGDDLEISPLARRFAHLDKLQFLEIAYASVQKLRRCRRGAHAKVIFLHQGHAQATQGGVMGQAGTGYAAADDYQIEGR